MAQSTLHNSTQAACGEPDWAHIHTKYIAMWDAHYDRILNTTTLHQFQNLHELVHIGYLDWFRRRTVVVLCRLIPTEVHGYHPSQMNAIQEILDDLDESRLDVGRSHHTTYSFRNIMYNTFNRVAQHLSRRGSRSMSKIRPSS